MIGQLWQSVGGTNGSLSVFGWLILWLFSLFGLV